MFRPAELTCFPTRDGCCWAWWLSEHGFDYAVTFVCDPRGARARYVVVFNREAPDEVTRMEAASEALVAAYDELGHPIGRTPTERQEWAMQRLPEFRRPASEIMAALDPKGLIAPGKYGIA